MDGLYFPLATPCPEIVTGIVPSGPVSFSFSISYLITELFSLVRLPWLILPTELPLDQLVMIKFDQFSLEIIVMLLSICRNRRAMGPVT